MATAGPVSSVRTPRHSHVDHGADSSGRSPRTVETPFQIQPPQFRLLHLERKARRLCGYVITLARKHEGGKPTRKGSCRSHHPLVGARGRGRGTGKRLPNGLRLSSWGERNVWKSMVVLVVHPRERIKCHRIIRSVMVDFWLCHSRLNNPTTRRMAPLPTREGPAGRPEALWGVLAAALPA